ncbi:MAG: SPFH domain-containing protein [Alphaproteobacteria bacterium]
MGLRGFLGKQFVDVIQWTEAGPGVLAYRYPMLDMEIRNKAVLTVRESQMALFVNEGKVADVFGAGRYELSTQTLPVLTYLKNWDKLFESPFKSDVYFFSTREQTDQKWGTATPITIRDKDFGVIRLRANGIYSYDISDVKTFWTKLSGSVETYTVDNIEGQLRAAILTAIASALGGSAIPFLDMAANQSMFSDKLKEAVTSVFTQYGLELKSFYVQSLSLPEELQEHLDKASSMRMVGDLNKYAQFQTAESLGIAAANPGGVAGAGVGLGAGVAMGQMMASSFANNAAAGAAAAGAAPDVFATLEKLGDLLKKGLVTQAEFDAKKAELLQQIK